MALAVVDLPAQGLDLAGGEVAFGLAGEPVLRGEVAGEVRQEQVEITA